MTSEAASERRQATILFADISGFTSMPEKLDPLGIHVGINTGKAISDAIAAVEKRVLVVRGDVINLASRLKDIAELGQMVAGPLS